VLVRSEEEAIMRRIAWMLTTLFIIAIFVCSAQAFDNKLWRADDPRIANPLNIYNPQNPLNPSNKYRPDNDFNSTNKYRYNNPLNPNNRYNPENQLNPTNKYSPDSPLNPINKYRSPSNPPQRGMFKYDW
jgi:hypothetical protein